MTVPFLLVLLSIHFASGGVSLAFSDDCPDYDCGSAVVKHFDEQSQTPKDESGNPIQRSIGWIKGSAQAVWEKTAGVIQPIWTLLSFDYDWWASSGWVLIDHLVHIFRTCLGVLQLVVIRQIFLTRRI